MNLVPVFERRASAGAAAGYEEESPLAIQQVALCAESRRLAVALPHGHVVLFKFRKAETHGETQVSKKINIVKLEGTFYR